MFKRLLASGMVFFFFVTSIIGPNTAWAQALMLPEPGVMVGPSPALMPVLIKGLKVHPENPLLFDFIVDAGKSGLKTDSAAFKAESEKLIKYFLTSLTVKENDLWVNLSPYEKDRVTSPDLEKTGLGADMLAQDYILKQLSASMIHPDKDMGKVFWQKVYAKTQEQFGSTDIPVDTFNKVWITADRAKVVERNNAAFVVDAHLKVMLETDYLASSNTQMPTRGHVALDADMAKGNVSPGTLPTSQPMNAEATQGSDPTTTQLPNVSEMSKQIIREVVIPEIEKEVNQGQNFAPLRQIFYSMILATWFQTSLKHAFLNQVYSNKAKTGGMLADDPQVKEKIYAQYVQTYKKGVFNFIKEDITSGQPVSRKYFSGGVPDLRTDMTQGILKVAHDFAQGESVPLLDAAQVQVDMSQVTKHAQDSAAQVDVDVQMDQMLAAMDLKVITDTATGNQRTIEFEGTEYSIELHYAPMIQRLMINLKVVDDQFLRNEFLPSLSVNLYEINDVQRLRNISLDAIKELMSDAMLRHRIRQDAGSLLVLDPRQMQIPDGLRLESMLMASRGFSYAVSGGLTLFTYPILEDDGPYRADLVGDSGIWRCDYPGPPYGNWKEIIDDIRQSFGVPDTKTDAAQQPLESGIVQTQKIRDTQVSGFIFFGKERSISAWDVCKNLEGIIKAMRTPDIKKMGGIFRRYVHVFDGKQSEVQLQSDLLGMMADVAGNEFVKTLKGNWVNSPDHIYAAGEKVRIGIRLPFLENNESNLQNMAKRFKSWAEFIQESLIEASNEGQEIRIKSLLKDTWDNLDRYIFAQSMKDSISKVLQQEISIDIIQRLRGVQSVTFSGEIQSHVPVATVERAKKAILNEVGQSMTISEVAALQRSNRIDQIIMVPYINNDFLYVVVRTAILGEAQVNELQAKLTKFEEQLANGVEVKILEGLQGTSIGASAIGSQVRNPAYMPKIVYSSDGIFRTQQEIAMIKDSHNIFPIYTEGGIRFGVALKKPSGQLDSSSTPSQESSARNGGIDLKPKDMALDVTKEGRGVVMNVDPAMAERFRNGNFTGIVPVITHITPITSVLPILGMTASESHVG